MKFSLAAVTLLVATSFVQASAFQPEPNPVDVNGVLDEMLKPENMKARARFEQHLLKNAKPHRELNEQQNGEQDDWQNEQMNQWNQWANQYENAWNPAQAIAEFGFDIDNYAIKYTGCHTVQGYNEDVAKTKNFDTVLGTEQYVTFRLCPADTCQDSGYKYGCSSNFGEYMISLDEWIAGLEIFRQEKAAGFCQYCEVCAALKGYREFSDQMKTIYQSVNTNAAQKFQYFKQSYYQEQVNAGAYYDMQNEILGYANEDAFWAQKYSDSAKQNQQNNQYGYQGNNDLYNSVLNDGANWWDFSGNNQYDSSSLYNDLSLNNKDGSYSDAYLNMNINSNAQFPTFCGKPLLPGFYDKNGNWRTGPVRQVIINGQVPENCDGVILQDNFMVLDASNGANQNQAADQYQQQQGGYQANQEGYQANQNGQAQNQNNQFDQLNYIFNGYTNVVYEVDEYDVNGQNQQGQNQQQGNWANGYQWVNGEQVQVDYAMAQAFEKGYCYITSPDNGEHFGFFTSQGNFQWLDSPSQGQNKNNLIYWDEQCFGAAPFGFDMVWNNVLDKDGDGQVDQGIDLDQLMAQQCPAEVTANCAYSYNDCLYMLHYSDLKDDTNLNENVQQTLYQHLAQDVFVELLQCRQSDYYYQDNVSGDQMADFDQSYYQKLYQQKQQYQQAIQNCDSQACVQNVYASMNTDATYQQWMLNSAKEVYTNYKKANEMYFVGATCASNGFDIELGVYHDFECYYLADDVDLETVLAETTVWMEDPNGKNQQDANDMNDYYNGNNANGNNGNGNNGNGEEEEKVFTKYAVSDIVSISDVANMQLEGITDTCVACKEVSFVAFSLLNTALTCLSPNNYTFYFSCSLKPLTCTSNS